jgi:hypothetical protein
MSDRIGAAPTRKRPVPWLAAAVAIAMLTVPAGGASQEATAAGRTPAVQPPAAATRPAPTDLDAFMARVLQRRDENWRKLHDYILSETETFVIDGPGKLPLNGFRREYAWYVREGFLIRSPLRFDGVAIAESERRKYEEEWLKHEQAREKRAGARAASKPADEKPGANADDLSLPSLVDQRNEPRFVSEAYFLRFTFEPGNYYLAGRERFDDREVLRIEYYPTELFGNRTHPRDHQPPAPGKPAKPRADDSKQQEIDRKLNKVSLITLWIDPTEYQIVKYTFDNTELDFLPGRWLVRPGEITASMTMARVLDGVWLPGQISMNAGLTVATGAYSVRYARTFHDYKKAEVGARVRILSPERP